jgi:hypothetical protein
MDGFIEYTYTNVKFGWVYVLLVPQILAQTTDSATMPGAHGNSALEMPPEDMAR